MRSDEQTQEHRQYRFSSDQLSLGRTSQIGREIESTFVSKDPRKFPLEKEEMHVKALSYFHVKSKLPGPCFMSWERVVFPARGLNTSETS
jgi:hypothetical protein